MNKFSLKNIALICGIGTILMMSSCGKETGCTDPDAVNYDPDAEENCCCVFETPTGDQNVIVSGSITTDTEWTSDNIYELANKVVVEDGVTLTIQAGTIIKGREGTGSLSSALIVARGGKIMANGTADSPIIFTSILDNIVRGQLTGTNLTEVDNAKWGGLIILGYAPISAEEGDNEAQIEGIPADEDFGRYGGGSNPNPADNSGVLRYVSIRHGGSLIGEGNEINGLTLGGVGTGTVIENVEVVANLDDGIECFGGTVNITNAIVAFQGDDGIDLDQNYSGTIDNFFVLHGIDTDEAMEIDGPEGTLNDGLFTLRNGTVQTTDGAGSAADLKSKAQGLIENTTFWGYANAKWLKLRCSFTDDCATPKTDAYDYFTNGSNNLVLSGCEFGNTAGDEMVSVYTKSEDESV
ncbi:MAG: hypothetical protein AAF487_04555, partial [Bacteroidota bacterium]